jgi:hypothetical protein
MGNIFSHHQTGRGRPSYKGRNGSAGSQIATGGIAARTRWGLQFPHIMHPPKRFPLPPEGGAAEPRPGDSPCRAWTQYKGLGVKIQRLNMEPSKPLVCLRVSPYPRRPLNAPPQQDYPSAVHPLQRYATPLAQPEPEYHPAPLPLPPENRDGDRSRSPTAPNTHWHFDHHLSPQLGGRDDDDNTRIMCWPCNLKKLNKPA